ncbi:SAV_6107 family HEPN domain-containing protein [Calidifontibacter terrae]
MSAAAHRSPAFPAPPVAVAGGVLDLVDRSRACLLEACHQSDLIERYRTAQLGAVRAAAAVLAARSTRSARSRPRPVWEVLAVVCPELGEWALFFADTARRVQLHDRGSAFPTTRDADDLIRQAETFLGLVLRVLGLPIGPVLDAVVAPQFRPS